MNNIPYEHFTYVDISVFFGFIVGFVLIVAPTNKAVKSVGALVLLFALTALVAFYGFGVKVK